MECGHGWIEAKATEIAVEPAAHEADPDTHRLMLAARQARDVFSKQRRRRQLKAAAWVGLAFLALAPLPAALAFPEKVVAAAPASIGLYDWLGQEVNIYGIAIHGLNIEHLNVEGRPVIAVKGELTNISGSERKLPWLRIGLRDENFAEVYSWQLNSGARPLKPGESRSFATRLASPPPAANKVEIRFARAEEIGSNTTP